MNTREQSAESDEFLAGRWAYRGMGDSPALLLYALMTGLERKELVAQWRRAAQRTRLEYAVKAVAIYRSAQRDVESLP
jgi:hypothetical protein